MHPTIHAAGLAAVLAKVATTVATTVVTLATVATVATTVNAQEDVADIESEDVLIGEDENKRYFRIGPRKKQKEYGLVVIMPGGDGGAAFHPFCKRIYKHAVPDDYVAVQPVAVRWTADQQIIWPKAKDKVGGAKFTTEEFVEEVIADVQDWTRIDPGRIFVVCWSSSGPAAYSLSLTKDSSPTGYFMAMSVFKKESLPNLKRARGNAYFIYHSEDDRVCPYRMAKDAEKTLGKKGAKVEFLDYKGGHGWRGPLYQDIGKGLKWLEKSHSKPAKKKRGKKTTRAKAAEAKDKAKDKAKGKDKQ